MADAAEVISAIRQQQTPNTGPHAVRAELLYPGARVAPAGHRRCASEPIPDHLLDALGLNGYCDEVTQNLPARMDDLKLSQMLGR